MESRNDVLPDPIVSAAGWHANELFERDDWLYELDAEELAEIDESLRVSEQSGRDVEQATVENFPLSRFASSLAKIQDRLERGCGACLLRRIPLQNYTETQLRRIFWGLAMHVGTPVSQSTSGEKMFSVRDEGFPESHPKARGPNTRKRLSFHTDRCDVIGFLCLRQALKGGDNQVVSSVALFNEIRRRWPDSVRVLMQPFWYKRHNVDQGNPNPFCQQPVFSFHAGHFAGSYLRVLIDRAHSMPDVPDLTDEQLLALERLETLANDPTFHVTFRQEPGDVLFLNNWVTFHRRDEFVDADTRAERRHLLRLWLAVPNSRPLNPLFAANYGSTDAGAIRGGMIAS